MVTAFQTGYKTLEEAETFRKIIQHPERYEVVGLVISLIQPSEPFAYFLRYKQ